MRMVLWAGGRYDGEQIKVSWLVIDIFGFCSVVDFGWFVLFLWVELILGVFF